MIDRFLAQFYESHPVDATFIGMHEHDTRLPEWGWNASQDDGFAMRRLRDDLDATHPLPRRADGAPDWGVLASDPAGLDAELARANLDVRLAEREPIGRTELNPALWTGEAVFSIVALMLRTFAPAGERATMLTARLSGLPRFIGEMQGRLSRQVPPGYLARARRECAAARRLFDVEVAQWASAHGVPAADAARLRAAAAVASAAIAAVEPTLADRPVDARFGPIESVGETHYAILLERGHFVRESPSVLLERAERELDDARRRLDDMTREIAGTPEALATMLATDHPTADGFIEAFGTRWNECRGLAATHDLVTWPDDWPLRYAPQPQWAWSVAPDLYFLHYRAPSPFDPYAVHEYLVAPLAREKSPEAVARTLSTWNRSQITLNHVVHHGALGHHVQNWHAARQTRSRIGRIAAVDGASRIAMLLGGSMAEGWACYATDLAEEFGMLTPLERAAEQQSRVRQLARAVLDIRLHCGEHSFAESVVFMRDTLGLPEAAAAGEVTKASMFPATAIMYWIGTQGIHDLRSAVQRREGAGFSLRRFHDTLLSWGSIPVPLITRLMLEGRPA